MKIHTDINKLPPIKNPVVTTGSFDGIHAGHRYIIQRLNEIARRVDGESVLITFFPHPRRVLFPEERRLLMINTQREKIKILSQTGLDHLIVIEFTLQFSKTSSVDFIRNYLVDKINVHTVVIGYDHNFGRNREGNFDYLYELGRYYGYEVEEIQAQDVNHVSVSSTKIRRALEAGEVERANNYLCRNYFICGKVLHGSRLGRKIGFRTARIDLEEDCKLTPKIGVYAVEVAINGDMYRGMLNIGATDSTLAIQLPEKIKLNCHIFDFENEIYGEYIDLIFHYRLREEYRFRNVQSLRRQLEQDRKAAEELLNSKTATE